MNIKMAASVRPSARQLKWQALEFYGFIHFGINTMTNNEWGQGHEDLSEFNPENLDARQWIRPLKAAGMKGAILTCKHHDGFCLWPSKYTTHTVASTPWKNGQGDVVKEFVEACKEFDMKFGFYLSPWDMTEASYGSGKGYDDFFVAQLEELLTNYGDVFEVWFDGANGEGPNGKRQYYDWERYYATIRHHQPDAVIAICGPDVRWIGNEGGHIRENEWSVVPRELKEAEKVAEISQQTADDPFLKELKSTNKDLGSRETLSSYKGQLIWYPAEVDVSIRPGWFHHPEENKDVKTASELYDLYKKTVGGNATLLLNIPPNRKGLIDPIDVEELKELGIKLKELEGENLLKDSQLEYSSAKDSITISDLLKASLESVYWSPQESDEQPWLEFTFAQETMLNTIILGEAIQEGQHIEAIRISGKVNGEWKHIIEVGSVGYKKIIEFDKVTLTGIKFEFIQFREKLNLTHIKFLNIDT